MDYHERNEKALYLSGRFLCAMDAMWRTLGYQTYPATKPSVSVVKVKMPEAVDLDIAKKQTSDFIIYMNRPSIAIFENFKFTELFKIYIVYNKVPARLTNMINQPQGYYVIYIPELDKEVSLTYIINDIITFIYA